MSDINVILATNRLQIARDGDDILINSDTYINIVSVNPIIYDPHTLIGYVPGMDSTNQPPFDVTEPDVQYAVQIHLVDGRQDVIRLSDVQNQVDWTNDQDGYEAAEEDIYAAFPSAGGGGTVTSVTGTAPIASSGGATPNITFDPVAAALLINAGATVAGNVQNVTAPATAVGATVTYVDIDNGTAVLPGSPTNGRLLVITDISGSAGTAFIDTNGNLINGSASTTVELVPFESYNIRFKTSSGSWIRA